MLGEGDSYAISLIIAFAVLHRARAFYYFLYVVTVFGIQYILKSIYHSPRPYMTVEDIVPKGCSSSYGHPSGHTLQIAAYLTFIWLDFYHSNECSQTQKSYGQQMEQKSKNMTIYIICTFVTFALPIFMGISRVYVGVHSYDHVLYGWLWGLWLAFAFHYFLRDFILKHFDIFLRFSDREKLLDSGNDTEILLAKASVLFFGSQILFIGSFLFVYYTFQIPQVWIDRTNAKCGSPPLPENFEYKTLIGAGYPVLIFKLRTLNILKVA
eukprot:403349990